MTIVVHHLQRSQSDRIVWLCEELGIPYELKTYRRDPKTLLAPPELKALHPAESAPIFEDGSLVLSESGAIMEYIIAKHGGGRLSVPASAPNYADYVYWFHWAIGTLQSAVMTPMFLSLAGITEDSGNPAAAAMGGRMTRALKRLDERLRQSPYLAGDELTAADIYAAFPVSTARLFYPFPLTGYDGILQWLKRCSERPAYKALIEKGEKGEDRGVVPTIMAEAPTPIWNIIQK